MERRPSIRFEEVRANAAARVWSRCRVTGENVTLCSSDRGGCDHPGKMHAGFGVQGCSVQMEVPMTRVEMPLNVRKTIVVSAIAEFLLDARKLILKNEHKLWLAFVFPGSTERLGRSLLSEQRGSSFARKVQEKRTPSRRGQTNRL